MKQLKAKAFKRLVGVERDTFDMMVSEIRRLHPPSKHKIPGKRRGPKPKLPKEDELLMLLMYYREYRTLFHIGADYGVSETQCWRIVTGIEKVLLQSGHFHLPGKKKLVSDDRKWEVVVIDASEHSIERPKKNSGTITREKRKSTR